MQSNSIPVCLESAARKHSPPPAGQYMPLSFCDSVRSPSCLRCAAAAATFYKSYLDNFSESSRFHLLNHHKNNGGPKQLSLADPIAITPLSLSFGPPVYVFFESHMCSRPRQHILLHIFQMISERFSGILPILPPIYLQCNLSGVVIFLATGDIQIFRPIQKQERPPRTFRLRLQRPFIISRGFKSCSRQKNKH